ncbi:hypothetical protein [Albidovulum sp.]|uniref:hypothetical protein n=1 Tax=Albidovulum sp. TaxID=1872424 RepID=UPI0025C03BA0|nr:hypothetical protein [Defluviimonas sp.]
MTAELKSETPVVPRKPRVVLMGEFSAGKSTLANLLLNETFSPVQVTATQMPPIWYSLGDAPAIRIAMDGSEEPLDSAGADTVSVRSTRAIRKFVQADILEACDLIDMPGSSDPHITEDIWQRMLPLADAVIWCTPATQAWRQSEAALWEDAPERLFPRSLLLVTRIDKVLSGDDRRRVLGRVQREAGPMFREVIPVSLIEAQDADGDPDAWRSSGLEAVLVGLEKIIIDLEETLADEPQADASDIFALAPAEADDVDAHIEATTPVRLRPAPDEAAQEWPVTAETRPDEAAPPATGGQAPVGRIVPRRVVLRPEEQGPSRRPRLPASASLI